MNIPAVPAFPPRVRGRGCGRGHGSIQQMYAISSSFSNPAVDGLHRGQISLRERATNFRNHAAEQAATHQADLDALNAYRNEQREQQLHQAQADARAQELLTGQEQNYAWQQELLAEQQQYHHAHQQEILAQQQQNYARQQELLAQQQNA